MRAGSPRLLREINDRAAIEALLQRGAMTRSEVEAIIGLSKPATAQLLTRLEQDGAVVRSGLRGGNRGPRAQLWAVNGALAHVVAVDLTPSYADIAVADVTGKILAEQHAELPEGGPEVVDAFAHAVRATVERAGLVPDQLCCVVVGSPGAVNPADGHLGFAPHLPGWEGFDMPGRLRQLLQAPVTVENDVNLVALEEMVAGRAREVDDFVLLWLSQGLGAAVVINRRLLRGATGGAGEIDWMRVPDLADADTGIDRRGIRLGDLLGSPTIVKLARAHGLSARTAWSAVDRALSLGAEGQPFLTDLARRIATGVAGVVSVVDPQLVVLAGETGQAGGQRLCDLVASELHRLVVPRTPVAPTLVTGNPVCAGALHSALALARQKVFGLTAAAAEPFRGSGGRQTGP